MRWRSALCARPRSPAVGRGGDRGRPGAAGGATPPAPSRLEAAAAWSGLVGSARVPGRRRASACIVVLTRLLARRPGRSGPAGSPSDRDERRWTAAAVAAQQQFISELGREGVVVKPEFRFTRTFNGFSAVLDPRAIAAARADAGREGRLPGSRRVSRRPSPRAARARGARRGRRGRACGSSGIAGPRRDDRAARHRRRPAHAVPARARARRHRRRRRAPRARSAQAKPTDPSQLERHGTEMAGLLVGAGGPGGLAGVAPAATVLPIRVAGWQPDSRGGYTVVRAHRPAARRARARRRPERRRRRARRGPDRARSRSSSRSPRSPTARSRAPSPGALAARHARRRRGRERRARRARPSAASAARRARPTRSPSARSTRAARGTDVRVVVRAGLSVLFDRLVPAGGRGGARAAHSCCRPAAPARLSTARPEFFDRGV